MRPGIDLNLQGLKCPLPVLKTRRALRRMAAGDRIVVRTTDPLAVIDIPHLVSSEGHCLAEESCADGVATFVIVKGGSAPR